MKVLVLLIGIGLAVLMTVERVQGALGEAENSVTSDKKTLSTNRETTTAYDGYRVKQIDSDAVTVREYISPAGIVFAISWKGLIHPDLAPLLGAYAREYEATLHQSTHQPGLRHLNVQTNQIIVEKWGQMRNLQGRAYVPALIPPGVNVDEIQ